jgi:PAS domain S-box-containing protein
MEYICSTDNPDFGEHYLADESPSETTAWLRKFLDAPNVGFAVCDADLRYLFINQALAEMNGLPIEAHLGKTLQDILGDFAEKVAPMFQRVFATGQTLEFELTAKLPTRNDVGHWTEHFFPIKDARGRVKQVGAVVVEVTEHKKLASRMTERAQHLERFLESSMSLISTLDENDLLPAISEFVGKVVRHDFASVALYDETARRLRLHALDSPLARDLIDGGALVPVTEDPYGATFLHGEARFHNRPIVDQRFAVFPSLAGGGHPVGVFSSIGCQTERSHRHSKPRL